MVSPLPNEVAPLAHKDYPPGTKPVHAGKDPWGQSLARIHAGPVSALARIEESLFEEPFSAYLPNLGEFISVRMQAAPVFAPVRTQENSWRIAYVLVSCQAAEILV